MSPISANTEYALSALREQVALALLAKVIAADRDRGEELVGMIEASAPQSPEPGRAVDLFA